VETPGSFRFRHRANRFEVSVTRTAAAISLLLALAPVRALPAQVDYARADLIRTAPSRMTGNPEWSGFLGFGSPSWLDDSTRFWYRVRTARGAEFILVDPVKAARRPLFDNARLASALSVAADTSFDPAKLPFRTFKFGTTETTISLKAGKFYYDCDISAYRCTKGDTVGTAPPDWAVVSPDKKWQAYVRTNNVWIKRVGPGAKDSVQLTTDGEPEFSYGLAMPDAPLPDPDARKPNLVWSPDSRKIAVVRIDDRGVQKLPVYSSTGISPKLFQYPMAYPGDSIVPTYQTHVLDIERKTNVKVDRPKQVLYVFGLLDADVTQWGPKSDRLYLMEAKRANKGLRILTADATTGSARVILQDSMPTFIENASGVFTGNWRVVGDEDLIYWSERDGWGHLYRYGLDGRLKNQITSGPWLVERIKWVDPVSKQIYFTALGRDSTLPYNSHLMRIGIDGAGLTDLTPEPGQHLVSVVPTGKFFTDIHSRPDLPAVTTLRSTLDGRKVLDLEKADATPMAALGWTPPKPFTVKARDGVTDLYGFLYLPSRIDTTRQYPVIVHIYPGPQVGSIYDWGYNVQGEPRGLAELGFVVMEVNALGTPGRSKAFHDAYYGNMGDNGIADQIAAVKQLAARYGFMDLDRVGIYGHSGGGFSSTGAILRYPDFFKVAVSGSGNHDNRSYRFEWGEKYQGRFKKDSTTGKDNFESQANYLLAGNLKGKLLLMHGDMDTNVHPQMTLRLVDALIKAEKDFDMLIVPDASHGLPNYTIKKRWDYFVRWLMGSEPDLSYHLIKCDEGC
jgi:dipeptidyl aminopeptidase/acylaminoacyl peptidase